MEDHVIWPVHFFIYYFDENKENFIVKAIQTTLNFQLTSAQLYGLYMYYLVYHIPNPHGSM